MLTKGLTQPKFIANRNLIMTLIVMTMATIAVGETSLEGPAIIWKNAQQKMISHYRSTEVEIPKYVNPCKQIDTIRENNLESTISRTYTELAQLCGKVYVKDYVPAVNKLIFVLVKQKHEKHIVKRQAEDWDKVIEPCLSCRYAASFPLIGPLIDDITQGHYNESHYNLIFSNRKRIQYLNSEMKLIKEQIRLQSLSNHENVQTLNHLVNVTKELDKRTESMNTILPQLIWKTSEIRVRFRELGQNLDRIRLSVLDNGNIDMQALLIVTQNELLSELDASSTVVTDFRVKKVAGDNNIILQLSTPIYSKTDTVYEAVTIPWRYDETTLYTYNGPKYIIANQEYNCTRTVTKVSKKMTDVCHKRNETIRDSIVHSWARRSASQEDIEEREKPVIVTYGDTVIVSCYSHNISIASNRTFPCPKQPMMIKNHLEFIIDDAIQHEVKTIYVTIDNDDEITIFQINSSLTETFTKITKGITAMDLYHHEIDEISNMTTIITRPEIIMGSGISLLVLIIIITSIACCFCNRNRLADAIVASSVISGLNRTVSQTSLTPSTGGSSINISIINQSGLEDKEKTRQVRFDKWRRPTPYPSDPDAKESGDVLPSAPSMYSYPDLSQDMPSPMGLIRYPDLTKITKHFTTEKIKSGSRTEPSALNSKGHHSKQKNTKSKPKPLIEMLNSKLKLSTLSLQGVKSKGDV